MLMMRQHAFGHFLRDEKRALDIGVKDEIEVLGRHVLQALRGADARVVHQNVDGAHFGFGMRHC